jgi:hypothetical protein
MVATMATDARTITRPRSRSGHRGRGRTNSDRATVGLFTVAAFLAVFSLLVHELPANGPRSGSTSVHVLRKIYRTTVVETILGTNGPPASSVTQSVTSSGSAGAVSVPTTHAS